MKLAHKLMVAPGSRVRLDKIAPDSTPGFADKEKAQAALERNITRMAELHYLLYAEGKRSLLVVFQAMDAAGKDGVIRHVMTGLNPQGCQVTSFKAPNSVELAHDFLWRVHRNVPSAGKMGIFNRSHYEDVLIVRVHNLVPKPVWSRRYDHINDFEKLLSAGGTRVLKFYLHISKEEQLQRLRKRLEDPARQWKVDPADFDERKRWDGYMEAYEEAMRKCSTRDCPWFIIPANHKWYRNAAVSQILVETMEEMKMKLPKPKFDISKIKIPE